MMWASKSLVKPATFFLAVSSVMRHFLKETQNVLKGFGFWEDVNQTDEDGLTLVSANGNT